MKKCFKCLLEKPLSEFYVHKQMGDGHLGKCKGCAKKDVHDRYYNPKFRPKIIEYEKNRFQDPNRKRKVYEYAKKRKKNNPLKRLANQAISNGKRNGSVVPQPCEVCGEIKVQAHHTDYSKPLDVQWLCFKHHREAHGQVVNI
jgi:hypothetical protein